MPDAVLDFFVAMQGLVGSTVTSLQEDREQDLAKSGSATATGNAAMGPADAEAGAVEPDTVVVAISATIIVLPPAVTRQNLAKAKAWVALRERFVEKAVDASAELVVNVAFTTVGAVTVQVLHTHALQALVQLAEQLLDQVS